MTLFEGGPGTVAPPRRYLPAGRRLADVPSTAGPSSSRRTRTGATSSCSISTSTVTTVPELGASHQTGWTGLVARLIQGSGEFDADSVLAGIHPMADGPAVLAPGRRIRGRRHHGPRRRAARPNRSHLPDRTGPWQSGIPKDPAALAGVSGHRDGQQLAQPPEDPRRTAGEARSSPAVMGRVAPRRRAQAFPGPGPQPLRVIRRSMTPAPPGARSPGRRCKQRRLSPYRERRSVRCPALSMAVTNASQRGSWLTGRHVCHRRSMATAHPLLHAEWSSRYRAGRLAAPGPAADHPGLQRPHRPRPPIRAASCTASPSRSSPSSARAPAAREQFGAELAALRRLSQLAQVATPRPGGGAFDGLAGRPGRALLLSEALPERPPEERGPRRVEVDRTGAGRRHQAQRAAIGLGEELGFFGPLPQDNRPVPSDRWADSQTERLIPMLRLAVDSGQPPSRPRGPASAGSRRDCRSSAVPSRAPRCCTVTPSRTTSSPPEPARS